MLLTAFHPVGLPDIERSFFYQYGGNLKWHPSGDYFYGFGQTTKDSLFSYNANWNGPGRWWFEWVTKTTRYIFKPMEQLAIMKKGSFKETKIRLNNSNDIKYKPGVYLQNKYFLDGKNNESLVSLNYGNQLIELGEKIGGYKFNL